MMTYIYIERERTSSNVFAFIFWNRSWTKYFLLQIIVDSKYHILNIVAANPGSMHDARMFRRSAIYHEFEQGN